jgi:hypothetical protein
MNRATAQEIVDLVYANPPQLMDAIKYLRMETALGLYDSKVMLSNSVSKEFLLAELCANFVDDKKDLLQRAVAERNRLERYIAQLESEIFDEEHE